MYVVLSLTDFAIICHNAWERQVQEVCLPSMIFMEFKESLDLKESCVVDLLMGSRGFFNKCARVKV